MSDLAEFHDELRNVARDLLTTTTDDARGWQAIVDAGWVGLEVSEDLGGSGASFSETAVVLEEMGRAASRVPFLGTAVLGIGLLRAVLTGTRRDELLSDAAAGRTRLAVAHAATGELPVSGPSFRLERNRATTGLTGRSDFVLDAPSADHLLVLADDPDRGAVLVALDRDDTVLQPRPVVDETRSFSDATVSSVVVGEEDVLVFEDAHRALAELSARAAVAVACDAVGVAAAMLDATVGYAGVREQFDRPVGSFQAVKHQCADMLVHLTVARELVSEAVDAVARGTTGSTLAAARAKSFATEMAVDVVGTALQLHGGIGYTWESGIHIHLKRALLDRSLFGSPAAHRRRLTDELGLTS